MAISYSDMHTHIHNTEQDSFMVNYCLRFTEHDSGTGQGCRGYAFRQTSEIAGDRADDPAEEEVT